MQRRTGRELWPSHRFGEVLARGFQELRIAIDDRGVQELTAKFSTSRFARGTSVSGSNESGSGSSGNPTMMKVEMTDKLYF